jgi:alkylation response protein AidB-like acyl-CoA dehydrogenase
MDFSTSEEQQAVRELARRILADGAAPEQLKQFDDPEAGFDRELWAELARAGLLGLALPADVGGRGLGLAELVLLLEEQGRHLVRLPLLPTLVMAALPIAEFGSAEQRRKLLAPVATGQEILSAAFTELGVADAEQPGLEARREGSGWRLDGEKICVPFADCASRILIPAATGEDAVGVFLLDPTAAGVELECQDTMNHEPQFRLALCGVRVDAADVLGRPDAGASLVRWTRDRALLGLAAVQLGVAEEALRRTAEYVSTRRQFGHPIGAFQGVALRAADAYIDVEAMRSTLWQATWRLSEGLPAEGSIAVAKWWACRGGQRVVYTAQHLHGGIGADLDYPIHRYFLWAKHCEITLGGASQQLARIGALLAGDEGPRP